MAGGGGGAALGISPDLRAFGGGCEGKGGGPDRGAARDGRGGGAIEGDMVGDRTGVLSSKFDSLALAFKASLCDAVGAMSVS